MEWTGLNALREKFLLFFEGKGHLRLPSYPLVPQADKSLLLINSGMAPMKKWFLGTEEPPRRRVATCQKCIRTPDIESVGVTDRHGTFFEMLGNFSFQDYFKKEAIAWAWEFFTGPEWMAIPASLLHVSVYEQDDDAYAIWTKDVGVAEDHMVRLGREDNFWEHGSGPCGPCSEIHFDRGEAHGCGRPGCGPGCECDRFIEVWNLVFTEFDSDGAGHYEKLARPNIDTGMGLERLACVMQGAANLFETDTVRSILSHVERLSGKRYGDARKDDISMRVITDHIRSTTFMASDGILPSNEGRGYVMRRLLRRAARHGRMLGITTPFLAEVCATALAQSAAAYPELAENAAYIQKTVSAEEERFARTIDAGLSRLAEVMEPLLTSSAPALISGADAFRLHDTFGFPLDLTREIAAEHKLGVDEEAFRAELQKQRETARRDRASRDIAGWETDLFAQADAPPTVFSGYDTLCGEGVVAALSGGEGLAHAVSTDEGEKDGVLVVLTQTPFYAESGGQVADTGILSGGGTRLAVRDVKKTAKGYYVHVCTLAEGTVRVGQALRAEVDAERRLAIMRNHTSAHLMQAALREVLGEHVHQAGSYVDDTRMRFDFTHFSALSREELALVEDTVNRKIFEALPVTALSMPIDEAKKLGAAALFGEKYGDIVRVVDVEGFSKELCGGTHVQNTARLGCLRILSESGVAAGVRRVESTTGRGVLRLLDERESLLQAAARELKLNSYAELPARAAALAAEARRMERELAAAKDAAADTAAADVFQNPAEACGVKIYAALLQGADADALRKLCDRIRESDPDGVGALAGGAGGKLTLAVCCGAGAVARGLAAGSIVKAAAALAGGSGGGRADFAMAGLKLADKAQQAVDAVAGIVRAELQKCK